jgi:hypothetical protein
LGIFAALCAAKIPNILFLLATGGGVKNHDDMLGYQRIAGELEKWIFFTHPLYYRPLEPKTPLILSGIKPVF